MIWCNPEIVVSSIYAFGIDAAGAPKALILPGKRRNVGVVFQLEINYWSIILLFRSDKI